MLKKNRERTSAICALILCAALLLGGAADHLLSCRAVRAGVVRLHVVADSDSDADQAVKLLVRDALLAESARLLEGADTAEAAAERLTAALPLLNRAAARVLTENGFSYGARASVGREYFGTRAYGGVTLPAGEYTSLTVRLGAARGRNWWCVLFPPLCLPEKADRTAEAFADAYGGAVCPAGGAEVRFRIAELAEAAWRWLRNR